MHFIGTRQKILSLPSDTNINLNGTLIERVMTYKCLGVHLDGKLTWETHVSEISGKISKTLAALRRLKSILPQRVLITIYKSLILPNLDYCSTVWGNIGKGLATNLQKLQNRAARIITGADYSVRSTQILQNLNWLSLEERRSQQFKKLMFKTMNKEVPEYLHEKFVLTNTVHSHNIRGVNDNVSIPRPQTEALKKGFVYRGACLWNSLPSKAKQATTLRSFNNNI